MTENLYRMKPGEGICSHGRTGFRGRIWEGCWECADEDPGAYEAFHQKKAFPGRSHPRTEIGKRLKAAGWTQTQVAEKLGISSTMVSLVLRGKGTRASKRKVWGFIQEVENGR